MENEPGTEGVSSLVTVGKQALRTGRWTDAEAAFREVLSVREHPEACMGLGEALWWLGHTERSVELYGRAHLGFRDDGDVVSAAWSALWLALSHGSDFGNAAAFRGWLSRAERLLDDGSTAIQGWLWLVSAYGNPDPLASQELARRAFDRACEVDDLDLELSALAHLGKALVSEGRTAEGLELVDEAMAGVFGGGCQSLLTVVLTSCSMIAACNLAADLERATQWCKSADDFISAHGCPFLYAQCRVGYGSILVYTGRWIEAEQQLEEALRATSNAYPPFRVEALARLADLRLDQGRLEEAEELLTGIEESPAAALTSARIHLSRKRPPVAAAIARRRAEALGNRSIEQSQALLLLVTALLGDKRLDSADETARQLTGLALRSGHPLMSARAEVGRARVLIAREEEEPAQRCLEKALDMYSALPLPLDAAQVRLELARLLKSAEPAVAVVEARKAMSVFEQLGARPQADTASELLRSLGERGRSRKRKRGALTAREQEVFRLLCAGLSNPVIADRLRISRKTAAHHVSNVLGKLGLKNRAQAAAYGNRFPEPGRGVGNRIER